MFSYRYVWSVLTHRRMLSLLGFEFFITLNFNLFFILHHFFDFLFLLFDFLGTFLENKKMFFFLFNYYTFYFFTMLLYSTSFHYLLSLLIFTTSFLYLFSLLIFSTLEWCYESFIWFGHNQNELRRENSRGQRGSKNYSEQHRYLHRIFNIFHRIFFLFFTDFSSCLYSNCFIFIVIF